MTEITRVPLQPIAKGSLTKIWLGVAAVALAAGGVAYAALPPQVHVKTLTAGSGESPTIADVVLINYKGTLPDGNVFDQAQQVPMALNEVIPGFTKALVKMQRGGKYEVEIPAKLAYGDKAVGKIPANTDLNFEIELLDFKSRAEIEQQQRLMQQLQQMQGGAPGGAIPGGAIPGGAIPDGAVPGAEGPAH
ncbi:FKBP-type peptidyl-prolyl cis-trans isomerase [Novosphingobium aerophilum]|uniref:FKBP-type peptidyl-prolyl cis-trans isomerase n=1 Tax=Novosphingobium TaxID=165696 RepID=UPI0012CF09FD|nr:MULTISPECIES: FKBP-type peptidyl-prolyl cis-trans isomerase [unclassified Novosphingobium]MPS69998.1 FKBP-type peptidyl-prolyl cis-trans isomerase [Novosphingobium sp.]WRT92319.1 FKBP-type peptidyl-prolyl cis-trans isomerase [Novosphingobium sp. RL4]